MKWNKIFMNIQTYSNNFHHRIVNTILSGNWTHFYTCLSIHFAAELSEKISKAEGVCSIHLCAIIQKPPQSFGVAALWLTCLKLLTRIRGLRFFLALIQLCWPGVPSWNSTRVPQTARPEMRLVWAYIYIYVHIYIYQKHCSCYILYY